MSLIIGLSFYFLGGFALGLLYHFGVRKRRFIEGLHLSVIFGFVVTIVVFVLAIVFDVTNLTPEPA
ncbi:MAG: hypothetical protein AAGM38_07845 [Pseudomonadota bacterium]